MTKAAPNPGSNGVEHIGILPTGVMYIDREIDSGDMMADFTLTDYVTALDVARLKAALSVTDAGLLGLFARRFSCGRDIVEWLHSAGIPTSHRGDDWTAGRPEVIDAATGAQLDALSAEKSAP
jgi:hypothetical protein